MEDLSVRLEIMKVLQCYSTSGNVIVMKLNIEFYSEDCFTTNWPLDKVFLNFCELINIQIIYR